MAKKKKPLLLSRLPLLKRRLRWKLLRLRLRWTLHLLTLHLLTLHLLRLLTLLPLLLPSNTGSRIENRPSGRFFFVRATRSPRAIGHAPARAV
ncbi:MAG: hypothetical protein IV085_01765 [Thiobacillus sp.]|nr:hypothetical protein [Thiobacillus sp.]